MPLYISLCYHCPQRTSLRVLSTVVLTLLYILLAVSSLKTKHLFFFVAFVYFQYLCSRWERSCLEGCVNGFCEAKPL